MSWLVSLPVSRKRRLLTTMVCGLWCSLAVHRTERCCMPEAWFAISDDSCGPQWDAGGRALLKAVVVLVLTVMKSRRTYSLPANC
ncbi:hypothetical protein P171DRAFT_436436 [Karstenula rhodostoma CBS 690.94]|uniref:Uncharacterized protein n=1 Tax=Karstenula rhodostoma CBS 690.94 TaxID=1392251 RepID=A0A9P4P8B4_9PLEO|nr:hypothetical protein P171DRAFT_436436 [Karstenula rhodostoma CBS 690.94]